MSNIAGKKNLANQLLSEEAAMEIALKAGEKAANCKCSETITHLGEPCPYCQWENQKDFNFIEHSLEDWGDS